MKKALALALALALLLALCGCGFGKKADSLAGTWALTGLTADGKDYSSMAGMFNMTLTFNEDGSGMLRSMDEEVPLTWDSSSFSDGAEDFPYSIDAEGKLSFEADGMLFICSRSS